MTDCLVQQSHLIHLLYLRRGKHLGWQPGLGNVGWTGTYVDLDAVRFIMAFIVQSVKVHMQSFVF